MGIKMKAVALMGEGMDGWGFGRGLMEMALTGSELGAPKFLQTQRQRNLHDGESET